jgi:sec-independent protein translocase protein TatB
MFGLGFFEIVIIAVAALLLVGPKKLPDLMRQAGKLFVQVRRTTNDVRSSIDQVIKEAEDDLRQKEINDLKNILNPNAGKSQTAIEAAAKPVDDIRPTHASPEGSHQYNPRGEDSHQHSDAGQHRETVDVPPIVQTPDSTGEKK